MTPEGTPSSVAAATAARATACTLTGGRNSGPASGVPASWRALGTFFRRDSTGPKRRPRGRWRVEETARSP
jgi:hypothetical protein